MIWAFGAAKFAHNSRGSASSPIWAFRTLLAALCLVVLVDEYNTSKRCSRCRSTGLVVKLARVPGEKKALHGVVKCDQCPGTINRDINSARNMLYCFWFQLSQRGARPPGFSPAKIKLVTITKGRMAKKAKEGKDNRVGAAGNVQNVPAPPTRDGPTPNGPAGRAAPAARGAPTTPQAPAPSSTSSRARKNGMTAGPSKGRKPKRASEAAPSKPAGKGRNRKREDLTSSDSSDSGGAGGFRRP